MLDETLQHILEFSKENKETLVLVTADHECGGISIGRSNEKLFLPEVLKEQKRWFGLYA